MGEMIACENISEFLEALKRMRILDDKIVQALNTSVPTESFSKKVDAKSTCKNLFDQLVANHSSRDVTLQRCIKITAASVQKYRAERDSSPEDPAVIKRLRSEQFKLRELERERSVEEVIRGRTLKLYNERCHLYYKPQGSA